MIIECSNETVTETTFSMNCSIEHLIEEELDEIIVKVTLIPSDAPMKSFSNSRVNGTWIEMIDLMPGVHYRVTLQPIIRSTNGIPYHLLITTVVEVPVFDSVWFFSTTVAVGNLTTDGSYDEIVVSLNLETVQGQLTFTMTDLLHWTFAKLIPGARYKVIAESISGPWSKKAEYLVDVEPSKPVVRNETLLPLGLPMNDNSSVKYMFNIEGRGSRIEYFVECLKNNETYNDTSIQFQNWIEFTFPRWVFGCKLEIRVLSYKSSPPFQYAIYLGFLTNVQWRIHHRDTRYVVVDYKFIGNADVLLVESTPPFPGGSTKTCNHAFASCSIIGASRGTPFYISLTPIIGDDRGTSEHFVYSLPIAAHRNVDSIRTASREETRLGLKTWYYGFVVKWHINFEPGDDMDVVIG